jgi:prolyl oligopeptidase
MRIARRLALFAVLALLAPACAQRRPPAARDLVEERLAYPTTTKVAQVDDYHGTRVEDPYRWLEDADSPQTRSWIEAQNRVTFSWLESIPERRWIQDRITKLWNFEKYGVPVRKGGRYFFTKNDGLQNQSVLYVMESVDGTPREVLNPNALSRDGTVALIKFVPSDDGRWLAYGLSTAGSDWQEWRVRDVETGLDLPDHLRWMKSWDVWWTKDSRGFFYTRYDEPNEKTKLSDVNYFEKLFHHRVGTTQAEDPLVYERRDQKEWGFTGHVTEDGRFLVIAVDRGTERKNLVFYKDLESEGAEVVELIREFEADYTFVGSDGPILWFKTDLDAPRGRLIAIDTTQPERSNWRELVPQAQETLTSAAVVGDRLVAVYLKDAHSAVRVFSLDGTFERAIELPGLGTASGFKGERGDPETFFAFTSFTIPAAIYRCDVASGETSVFRAPTVDVDPSAFETKQVFYRSKDGTRIPMFLTHRKGLALDGKNPTLLYGYGGFNISLTPSFSVANLVWMEMGGVYAQPNLRGGGEYGERWHRTGTKLQKQNVFDDFIAAADWLIANRYTSPSNLAIFGGSNGGLLVGACMTQRPDLFAAALPAVGVLDMLRFHKFTVGWMWTSDYGSADDPQEFQALLAYSPLHNLRPGTRYPATLITTADHDDRVVPAHSFKFASALQAAQAGPAPALIRIETKAGHGAGKPTSKQIEEAADRFAFLVRVLGMELPAGGA